MLAVRAAANDDYTRVRDFYYSLIGAMENAEYKPGWEKNITAIRLDVLGGNIPAEKAYTRMGFVYRGTINMFYEDTGWTGYRLFEYVV